MQFEWDAAKTKSNVAKHGVTFDEAVTAFADPLAITYRDAEHSVDELRYITVAASNRQRLLVIAHVDRGPDRIRIISARLATRKETQDHEET